jgi:hypothetical protein
MRDSGAWGRTGADSCDARIGEALNEFIDRRARGEPVSEADLIDQNPTFGDDLRRHLEFLKGFEPPGDQIGRLVAGGVLDGPVDSRGLARLGPYRIIGFLGRGGMSFVLKAYEESLDRVVALKILRPELTHDDHALKRFTREAKAAAGLQHPNIVTVHAVGLEGGTHYLSMEFIDGPTLASLIRSCGPLQAVTIHHLMRQVLGGLGAAHRAHLVHRDVKPSNILLAGMWSETAVESGTELADEQPLVAKIADFGLARVISSQSRITMPDSVLGTPAYMSPEQARGEPEIDHRSDLYSAGVVLYEMLTGRAPFTAEAPSAVVHQILHRDPPDPHTINGNVDPHLATISLRMMAKRPEDRFDSAEEVLAAVAAAKGIRLPQRRRRRFRRLSAVALAFGVVAAAVWLLSGLTAHDAGPEVQNAAPPMPVEVGAADPNGARYEQLKACVWARFENRPNDECFLDLSEHGQVVRRATVVRSGQGDRGDVILAALHHPLSVNVLMAFSASRNLLWARDLWPEFEIDWPDLDRRSSAWLPRDVASLPAEADGALRAVIAANDFEQYPARVAVIDARDGHELARFWHFGRIERVVVLDDFFENDRPAILAWGVNNKLDGFGDPAPRPYAPGPGEDPPATDLAIVGVVMILDPQAMDGIGPPRTTRTGLPYAAPYAYAFLDLPSGRDTMPGDRVPGDSEIAVITEVDVRNYRTDHEHERPIHVEIRDGGRDHKAPRCSIHVGRRLHPVLIDVNPQERHLLRKEDWLARWHWMDQEGRFQTGR